MLDPELPEPLHVCPVVPVAAVFVLDLQHDDGPSACDEERPNHVRQARDVTFDRLHVPRIQAADLQLRIAKEVRWQPAKVPLSAHVRPRPEEHPHAFFLDGAHEARHVPVAGLEVESALLRLVVVPEEVGRDGVAAHRAGHPDAVPPVLGGNARGVKLARDDPERPAVEQESVLAQGERVAVRRLRSLRRPAHERPGGKARREDAPHPSLRMHYERKARTGSLVWGSQRDPQTARTRRRERTDQEPAYVRATRKPTWYQAWLGSSGPR